jgi:caa(3)-type oxidase subunit IV
MSEHGHAEASIRTYMMVWGVLLVLTAVEVYLGYIHLPVAAMLSLLMGLSLIKAGMIIAYFMHLKFETRALVLTLLPMWIVVTCLLFVFFPDSFRALQLRFPQ